MDDSYPVGAKDEHVGIAVGQPIPEMDTRLGIEAIRGPPMVFSLAPELLSRIFSMVVDREGYGNLKWMRLLSVCGYFREVGLAHCELWSHITIPMLQPLSNEAALESYRVRLERTKGFPLSVTLHYSIEAEYFIGTKTSPLWRPVAGNLKELIISPPNPRLRMPNGPRWDSQSSLEFFLNQLASEKHPHLVYFSLDPSRPGHGQPYSSEISRILSASAVRYVHLALVPRTVSPNLPFLATLSLTLPHSEDAMLILLEFLRLCPALSSLSLYGTLVDTDVQCPPGRVELPSLRRFSYDGELPIANAFLKSVTLPRADCLSLKLQSLEPDDGLEQLVANLKYYFLCSPAASAGAHMLYACQHHFFATVMRDGQEITTLSIAAGDPHIDPELDLDDIFVSLLPAFLTAVPLACIDARFKHVHSRVLLGSPLGFPPIPGPPSLPYATDRDKTVLVIQLDYCAFLFLDVLRTLLPIPDVRTHISRIIVDMSAFEDKDFEYAQQAFACVCTYLRDAKGAGKTLDVVEILHTAVSRDKAGLIPLDEMRGLVMEGVIVDSVLQAVTL